MANYATLKAAIQDVVKTNGNKEITGLLLQQTLLAIIDSLGSQYQFAGKAVEGTTPGTIDTKVAYLAGPGAYVNFGGAVIPEQHIGILYGSGSTWNVSIIKVSPIAVQTVVDDIIQLYDGSTPVYPRTKAEAVFFDNDTTKTLDQQFNQLGQKVDGFPFDQEGLIKLDGTINPNASFSHTDLIKVEEGDIFYYVGRIGGTYLCVAGYSAKDFNTFVSSLLSADTYTKYQRIVIPSGINYISAGSANDTSSSLIKANGLLDSAKTDITSMATAVAGNTQDIKKKSGVAIFYSGSLVAFNTTTKKVTIPAGRIVSNSVTISTSSQTIDLTQTSDGESVAYGAIIVYDLATSAFKVIKNNYATEDFNLLPFASYFGFGTQTTSNHYVNGAFVYTIDGDLYGIHIPTFGNSQMAVVLNTQSVIPLQFDSVNKTLTIKGYSRFFMNNKYLLPSANTNDSVIDLTKDKDGNTVQHGVIAYRISNRDFKIYPNNQTSEDWNLAIIATYRFGSSTSKMFINTPSYYSVDGNPYGIKVPTIEMPLYQPDYELIELPNTIAWWSDIIKVQVNGVDELWFFCPSSGEEHATLSGYIYRVSMTDWSLIGSIRHDFGHCNTCHYLPEKDVLLIGNLPGNTAYPSALYIFYGVSSWVGETKLRFENVSKTIVDISALGMNNISAVFAESNGSERNIVMVQDSVTTHKVAKLLLGMGSNQLAGGVFDAGASADKYNGTYQVLIQPIAYETFYNNTNEVIQGIDYHNGNVYSSNGHGTIRGFVWKNTRIGNVIREQLLLPCYDGVGGVAYKTSEGILVDGEYTYQGAIPVTNESGTTKDTSLPFAIIKYKTIK